MLRCRSPRMQRSSYRFPTSPSLFLSFSLSLLTHTQHSPIPPHSRAPFVVARDKRAVIYRYLYRYLPTYVVQRYIAEPPSFNFPDLLDITRGCHAAYKRPRINDLLVHYESVTFCSKTSARRDTALNSIFRMRTKCHFSST